MAARSSDFDIPLLQVEDLVVRFHTRVRGEFMRKRVVTAVDGVSFSIGAGRTLGLVGESGSGKTTVGLSVLRSVDASSGRVWLNGVDLMKLSNRDLRERRKEIQVVFQDPSSSLNPRHTVAQILTEPLEVHGTPHGMTTAERVEELLDQVGLDGSISRRYPHEFSGGQRQRIAIARALAVQPDLIICDEPVSALDVSVQAQILKLLAQLQADFGISYLFISHDMGVIRHVADDIAVMYLGRIVEHGPARRVLEHPAHPYTMALLSAAPSHGIVDSLSTKRIQLVGEIPSPASVPAGCRFRTRCWLNTELGGPSICVDCDPELATTSASDDQRAACHFALPG